MLHMICGSTGAGKTTYAMQLESELPGVRFSIDDWMMTLFWQDAPAELNFDWAYERVSRCNQVMREAAANISATGGQAILDVAFTTRDERASLLEWASARNLLVFIHFLDISADIRWQRVLSRNEVQGDTYAFPVSRDMFDFIEQRWQAPTADELAGIPHKRIVL